MIRTTTNQQEAIRRSSVVRRPSSGSIACAILVVASFALSLWAVTNTPPYEKGISGVGPFWAIFPAWVGVAALAALSMLVENRIVRAISVLLFGVVTIGLLGYLEPFGVFHDSWRNVGLGQLSLNPQYTEQTLSNSYVAGSPVGFVVLGVIRLFMPDTATMLQLYPMLTVLIYCPGIYLMSLAFADAHFPGYANAPRNAAHRVRFGLISVFTFLSIASVFSVRINPAPQSVAFALMPFFLAAILRSRQKVSYRLWALLLFGAIVLTHPITSLMVALICAAFFASDILIRSAKQRVPVIGSNTVILYATVFVAWLIYIGVWVVKAGSGFFTRMFSALNSGQIAVVSAGGRDVAWDFVWVHRVAMTLAGALVLLGMVVVWRANRAAGARLTAWFVVSAIWLPFMMLGEFADRGPLFASLPASISIAFLLNMRLMSSSTRRLTLKAQATKIAIIVAVVALAGTSFATSYPNHAGEIITAQEVAAFEAIAQKAGDTRIAYGYMPPLTEGNLPRYIANQFSAYAMGAADFTYDKFLNYPGVIVVSDNMRQAAELRGTRALADYDAFIAVLETSDRYKMIYANDTVQAYQPR